MTEFEIATKIKKELDNHIKNDGNQSSALQYNIETSDILKNTNIKKLSEESKNLGFYIQFIGNTNLKNFVNQELYNKLIIVSYEENL